jgi:uncharacterized protein (DUF1015 family)
MALVATFRALRPAPGAAAAVAAVPYDVVNTAEARHLASGRPLNFLHVSRAELGLPEGTDPYSDEVYKAARANFDRVIAQAPLVLEDQPSLYFYRLTMASHVQTGLAGAFSLDDYDRDVIRKHEKTRRDKEDDRTRHIIELRAQTGPVFLTYPASSIVDTIAIHATGASPLIDITAEDGVRHTLWRVCGNEARAVVDAFGAIPTLYIADGHHRAASAARARQKVRDPHGPTSQPADTFLAVAFPHDQVQILPYNRTVKDLHGKRPGEILEALGALHHVAPGPAVPARKGDVSMFLAGQWYSVTLRQPTAPGSPIEALDVSLLQDQVLGPLLGIGDPRVDTRIDFVGGARGTAALERAVGTGAAAVAFSLLPVTVADLMAISDAGEIMPPKSTWFEPKLRDGLLIHVI